MEAIARIYSLFPGKKNLTRKDIAPLEIILKAEGFHLWETTIYPGRKMISYGGKDDMDYEKTLQGYGEEKRGIRVVEIVGYEIVANGKDLIDFLEKLVPEDYI